MKKDDFSFLDIFQDPLVTIIAIVLFSTVWMIIPKEPKAVDPKVYLSLEEIDTLKREIETLKETIIRLQKEIQQRKEEIDWLESMIERAKEEFEEKKGKNIIEPTNEEIISIRNKIEKKKEELRRLEEELKNAKDKLLNVKKDDTEVILETIRQKREIEKRKEELASLEEKIRQAVKDIERTKDTENSRRNLVAQLQNEFKAELEEIKRLEQNLQSDEEKTSSGGCFRSIKETQKENDFPIQLINNRLYFIDEKYYDIKSGYVKIQDGRTVFVKVMRRMTSTKGENIDEIQKTDSEFQKKLRELDRKKYRIGFYLNNDSFEIFRKSREIVNKNNFEMTWLPNEREEIISISGSTRAGSTNLIN